MEFNTEQLSPGTRKLSAAIATDVETERELEPAPTKIKRAYNKKAKANIIEKKQLPMERLNAPRLLNKRYRASKESSSNKVQSVLAPTLPPLVVSIPLSTS